jgi:hypothetical protein
MALSAKLSADHAAQAGSDYARSAAQTAAALERIPLVVGFSDRRHDDAPPRAAVGRPRETVGRPVQPNATIKSDAPQFGWVFGPKVRFDSQQQRFLFEQTLSSYDVASDVSVPSWWPRVELEVETA